MRLTDRYVLYILDTKLIPESLGVIELDVRAGLKLKSCNFYIERKYILREMLTAGKCEQKMVL